MKNYWLQQRTARLAEAAVPNQIHIAGSKRALLAQIEKVQRDKTRRTASAAVVKLDDCPSNEALLALCAAHRSRPDPFTETHLARAFYKLAEKVVDYCRFEVLDRDDALQECVTIAFEKLHRLDPEKHKPFNFFTTLMASVLRVKYRAVRNYEELKRRYAVFLAEKTG